MTGMRLKRFWSTNKFWEAITINVIETGALVENAKALGEYFLSELGRIESKKIREVRGLGLMIGLELKEKAGPYVQKLMEQGVIALLAGATVIRRCRPW
jgi:acetylornithine/LysW-gamma-L-lysine aminotransferase